MPEPVILDVMFLVFSFIIGYFFDGRGRGRTALSNFLILSLFCWGLIFSHRFEQNPKLVLIPIIGVVTTFLAVRTAISIERGRHEGIGEYTTVKYQILMLLGRNIVALAIQIGLIIYINT